MAQSESFKNFSRAFGRWGLHTFYFLFSILPFFIVSFLLKIFLFFGFFLMRRQQKTAEGNLKIAFGYDFDDKKIKKITRKCFYNLAYGLGEMMHFLSHPHLVRDRISVEGNEKIEEALRAGNGAIIVVAHFGNFPLMMMYYAQLGFKVNTILKTIRDEGVEEFLATKRAQVGIQSIFSEPKIKCVGESIKALRRNELLFIPIDQNFGSDGGVYVDFFGRNAATATGPAVFSLRTGAPIIPMFIIRQEDNSHKIVVEDPIVIKDNDDEECQIKAIIQSATKVVEDYVRQYPHEWAWMHRRWKSRPYFVKYMPNA